MLRLREGSRFLYRGREVAVVRTERINAKDPDERVAVVQHTSGKYRQVIHTTAGALKPLPRQNRKTHLPMPTPPRGE